MRVFNVVRRWHVVASRVASRVASYAEDLLGAACQCVPDDFSWMDGDSVGLAASELGEANQALIAVQEECGEDRLGWETSLIRRKRRSRCGSRKIFTPMRRRWERSASALWMMVSGSAGS